MTTEIIDNITFNCENGSVYIRRIDAKRGGVIVIVTPDADGPSMCLTAYESLMVGQAIQQFGRQLGDVLYGPNGQPVPAPSTI